LQNNSFIKRAKTQLARTVCVYDGTKRFFDLREAGLVRLSDAGSASPLIVIVARELYFESDYWVPVDSLAEARKILKNSPPRSPCPGLAVRRLKERDGRIQVREAVVPDEVLKAFSRTAVLFIPEAWILGDRAAPVGSLSEYTRRGKLLAIASTALGFESAAYSPDSYERDAFALSAGLQIEQVTEVAEPDYATALWAGISRLNATDWRACFKPPAVPDFEALPWPFFGALGVVGLSAYIATAWLTLTLSMASVDRQLSAISGDIAGIAEKRRSVQEQASILDELQGAASGAVPYWQLWQIMRALQNQGVDIVAMSYQRDLVEFSGTAESATQVLESLMQRADVESAEFALPVRGDMGSKKDFFAISMRVALQDPMPTLEPTKSLASPVEAAGES
jgi:hypothetical protein